MKIFATTGRVGWSCRSLAEDGLTPVPPLVKVLDQAAAQQPEGEPTSRDNRFHTKTIPASRVTGTGQMSPGHLQLPEMMADKQRYVKIIHTLYRTGNRPDRFDHEQLSPTTSIAILTPAVGVVGHSDRRALRYCRQSNPAAFPASFFRSGPLSG